MTDPAPVLDLLDAFRKSKALFTATSLGVFDLLAEAPAGAAELARRTGTDEGALKRLLDACTGLGLLANSGGAYRNQPVADVYIRRSSPRTIAGYILYSNQVLFRMWGNLDDAIREGTHRWPQTFQMDGQIFDHFFQTPEALRTFIQGMHGLGMISSPKVAAAFDLSGFRRLADLGGATGHLAIAACRRYPDLRATVFDLGPVVEIAREYVTEAGLENRIDLVAGDFFTSELPPADLYAVGRILHDWSEPKIRRLLERIYAALPPGGGLLIAEKILEESGDGPLTAQLQSLNMLLCTEGRERTLAEYRALLEEAGFAGVEGIQTGAPLDAMLARKP
jgi:acetylserotonin N-methyltransferase